ncbi:MAG: hypothetical protein LBC91_05185 [Candidatus Accumulibacter sp.]|jgi:hypothetical protein|nr:hypothetical protein [Accumulibacter sp.]
MVISGISAGVGFSPYPRDVFGATEPSGRASSGKEAADEAGSANAPRKRNGEALSEDELREVEKLKTTDRKVRQHEQAHVAAGGDMVTSGATYGYVMGPDGQRYAVSGEVGIDTSPGRTPEETLRRAARIRAAALAPADPSPQDRNVAAQAARMQMQAAQEIAMRQWSEESGESEDDAETPALSGIKATEGKSGSAKETSGQDDFSAASAAQIGAYRAMAEAGAPHPTTGGFFARV